MDTHSLCLNSWGSQPSECTHLPYI